MKCAICKKKITLKESQSYPRDLGFQICHLDCAMKNPRSLSVNTGADCKQSLLKYDEVK